MFRITNWAARQLGSAPVMRRRADARRLDSSSSSQPRRSNSLKTGRELLYLRCTHAHTVMENMREHSLWSLVQIVGLARSFPRM